VIELSTYVFEVLRKDNEFILTAGAVRTMHLKFWCFRRRQSVPHRKARSGSSTNIRFEKCWIPGGLPDRWPWLATGGRTVLVLEDPGGMPLDQSTDGSAGGLPYRSSDLRFCLRIAISLANAIGHLHERGLIHKDLKPANVLVNAVTGQCWLRGFGIASRLLRERVNR
jgi:serine/threonine protein kinase